MWLYLVFASLILLCYLVYEVILKVYVYWWKFKKMDPSLRSYVFPVFGMAFIQR